MQSFERPASVHPSATSVHPIGGDGRRILKVAVTGANGFIGRCVLAELAKYPVEIIAVTRREAEGLPAIPKMRTIRLDLMDAAPDTFDLLSQPDVLIHLAWGGLPDYKSLHHFEQELPIQYRFLKKMILSGLRSLFVAGTCFEYGMQYGPLNEDMETHPNNPYGCAKDMLRRQLEYLKKLHPFALTWARLFYLYGEGQGEKSLFSQLRQSVERGDTIFNMSGGEQLRDYLSVTEVVETIVYLALLERDICIVNICSGKPVSVRNLVEDWIEENDWAIECNRGYYPYPDYEPMAFWGDRGKLDNYLGNR